MIRTTLFAPEWRELQTFYESAFDWHSTGPRQDGAVDLFTRDEKPVASYQRMPQAWASTRRSLWVTFFGVRNLNAAIDHAVELGADVLARLSPEPSSALLIDDQGALFGIQVTDR